MNSNFETADALYEAGRLTEAFEMFAQIAEAGDTAAMLRVASMLSCGEGAPYDLDGAIALEDKAAKQGDPTALINLGISYRCKGDLIKSRQCFVEAVAAGQAEAALELARLYLISDLEHDSVIQYAKTAIELGYLSDNSRSIAEQYAKGNFNL